MNLMDWIGLLLCARHLRLPGGGAALSGEILMTAQGVFQVLVYLGILVALAKPLGTFMAAVYEGRRTFLSPRVASARRR